MRERKPLLKAFRKAASGQAQVEFVLTILFVLLLIFLIFEGIMLIYTYNVLADAAKEGVRYAIVHGSGNTNGSGPGCADTAGDNVKSVVRNYAKLCFHDVSGMTVTPDYIEGSCDSQNGAHPLIRITVSYPYKPLLGFGWPGLIVRAAAEGRIVN